jgi:multiple antibiotic resistance protein
MHLSFKEILAAFMVLFAIIDIPGSIPIIIDIKSKGVRIKLFLTNTGIVLPHVR